MNYRMQNLKQYPSYYGVFLYLSSVVLFVGMDTSIKYLVSDYSIYFILWVRYVAMCVAIGIFMRPQKIPNPPTQYGSHLQIARGLALVGTSLFVGLALQRMNIAETSAICFLAPMFVFLLAKKILGEKITLRDLLVALMGFSGVMVIIQPQLDAAPLGIFYAALAAICGAIYQILSKKLVDSNNLREMMLYPSCIGVLIFGVSMPWELSMLHLRWLDSLLMLSIGVLGFTGHVLYTMAHRTHAASYLAPLNYTYLIFAIPMSQLVFHYNPTRFDLYGIALLLLSGLLRFSNIQNKQ